jgi:hypothetical protein
MTKKSSDWFRQVSERLRQRFQNTEFVCEKYHVCMLSTNVNHYFTFQPPQQTWWVYEWGAQVRKYKYGKSPYSIKPSSSIDHSNHPIEYNYIQRKILVKGPELQFLYTVQRCSRSKDPLRLQFTHERNKTNDLDHSLREAPEFKIITFLLIPVKENPQRSN